MITKRTKVLAVLVVVCAVFVYAAEYKDFHRYRELSASWKGQEQVFASLDVAPQASPLVKAVFVLGAISLVATFGSLVIDIRHVWLRQQR
jgi:hypothetical protein